MNIEEILTKHIGEDGTFDKEAAAKELNQELPKSFVPKHKFNEQAEKLKEASDTITQLQESNKDNADLQKEVEEYKTRIADLEAESAKQTLNHLAENALREAGAKDIAYALYKLGELESDGNGGIKDLENKIKEFKESSPLQFESNDSASGDNLSGFKPVDTTLKNGAVASKSELDAMVEAMTSDLSTSN